MQLNEKQREALREYMLKAKPDELFNREIQTLNKDLKQLEMDTQEGFVVLNSKIEETKTTLEGKISKVKTIKGEDGKDGKDGRDGLDGKDGKPGKDGRPGKDGKDGRDGMDGKDGVTPVRGEDYFTDEDIETISLDVQAMLEPYLLELRSDQDKVAADIEKRAVDILDQRTQFLINKKIRWESITGSPSDSSALVSYIESKVFFPNPLDAGTQDDTEGDAEIGFDGGDMEDYQKVLSVSDTAEIDMDLTADVLSASIVAGSIDETKLDASVNASLDLADSALQAESDTLQTVTDRGATTTNTTTFSPTGNDGAIVVNGVGSGIGADINHSGSGTSLNIDHSGSGSEIVVNTNEMVVSGGNINITGGLYVDDNQSVSFGTGDDARISYNGSDLIISPKYLGTGRLAIDGELEVTEKFRTNVVSVTTTTHTAGDEHVIACYDNTAGGDITITLPAVSTNAGVQYVIKKMENTYNVIIDGNASETIDGATTATLTTQYESVTLVCDGTQWLVI